MSSREKPLSAVVVGTGFIGPVHVEGLRRAGVHVGRYRRFIARQIASRGRATWLAARLCDARRSAGRSGGGLGASGDAESIAFRASGGRAARWQALLCEKPLAMTSVETAELVRIAAQSGRAAGVAYNIRFYPLCHEAAARVADGSLGDVLHVTGSYVQDWLLYNTDFNWRVLTEDGGELRAVADIGTHWLDLVQFVTGRKVTAICADLRTVHATPATSTRRSGDVAGKKRFAARGPSQWLSLRTIAAR